MEAIREPRGRAKEYSLLACDPYWGACSHFCSYCYVAGSMRRTQEQWSQIPLAPRRDFLKHLRRDAAKYRGTDKRVLLSFTSDVYCEPAVKSGLTRQVLEVLREFDIPFQVLTKGGLRAVSDFDLYGPNDAFATTLTCILPSEQDKVEPHAAGPADRAFAIAEAWRRGIETWVSLEPVLNPADALYWIEKTAPMVGLFKIGKLNHDKEKEAQIDWRAFGMSAIALCEHYGKAYYVKDDLAKYLVGVKYTSTDTRRVIRPC